MTRSIAETGALAHGLNHRTRHEIAGLLVLLSAAFLALSIAVHSSHPRMVGALGQWIGFCLSLAMGKIAAYAAPAFMAMLAVVIFRGSRLGKFMLRTTGLVGFCVSLCGLLSLTMNAGETELVDRARSLALSGIIGEFLVTPEGMGLPYLIGWAGAWLLCIGVLIVSFVLMTDFLFASFMARQAGRLLALLRQRRELREARSRIFPATDPEHVFGPPRPRGDDAGPSGPIPIDHHHFRQPGAETPTGGPGDEDSLTAAQDDLFREPISGPAPRKTRGAKRAEDVGEPAPVQQELELFAEYELPPITLLAARPPHIKQTPEKDLYALAGILERKLLDFGIEAKVTQITQGPVITRFELKPSAGVKVNKITNLANDLAMAMAAVSIRIQAPIPGKDAIGIEVPNPDPSPVFLREIMEAPAFEKAKNPLTFCLGKTIAGDPTVCDLATMPHLLIAGTTGSGKSVCLNAIICSFLMRQPPDKLKFIMVDPKRVELNVYQDIPHLLAPVVNDPRKAAGALNWLVEQMEERYKLLSELNVRNIDGYNALVTSNEPTDRLLKVMEAQGGRRLEPMPHVVVVIDELADLMLIARNEVEETIIRLAQMARAVGIHLIVATQRPSVNVITGIIKANFPARVAFQVSAIADSRTILDIKGAETLIGRGDMLYMASNSPRPVRLQGCFVSDKEVEAVAEFIRNQEHAHYVKQDFKAPARKKELARASEASRKGDEWEVMGQMRDEEGNPLSPNEIWNEYLADDLFRTSVRLVLQNRKASVSLIQRRLKVGFSRAGRLVDMMQEAGLVGPFLGSKPREIVIDPVEYLNLLDSYEATQGEE